ARDDGEERRQGVAVSLDVSRLVRRVPRWIEELPAARASQDSDRELLVGRRLRRVESLGAPDRSEAPVGEPVRQTEDERRRQREQLPRPGDSKGTGEELDSNRAGPRVVSDLPLLQSARGVLRQELEAQRRREGA